MSLVLTVAARLDEERVPFALIGAGAMAYHGVSRATADLDLLAIDGRCLETAMWQPLVAAAIQVETRRGDAADPLAGVVRFALPPSDEEVDLVVGWGGWQAGVLTAATRQPFAGGTLPVARRSSLILLKLYAGGPQDAWDISRLLTDATPADTAAVEDGLGRLPPRCRRLWETVRQQPQEGA